MIIREVEVGWRIRRAGVMIVKAAAAEMAARAGIVSI